MKKVIFIIILTIFLVTTAEAFADYTLLQPLGGVSGEFGEVTSTNLSSYIQQIIKIAIVLAGLLAVVKIVIGGIIYISAAGSPGNLDKAKDMIWDAIIGIVIAVSFYIILYAVNPDILKTDGLIPVLKTDPQTGKGINLTEPEKKPFGNWQGKCTNYPYGEIICLGNTETGCVQDCMTKCKKFFSVGWKITEGCKEVKYTPPPQAETWEGKIYCKESKNGGGEFYIPFSVTSSNNPYLECLNAEAGKRTECAQKCALGINGCLTTEACSKKQ